MQQESHFAKDPRFAELKARLIRKVHLDLPYAIRFLSRMDRLGARCHAGEIHLIVNDLRSALLKEVGDIVLERRASSNERLRRLVTAQ
ncbi:MAG TPA: hypothetical protein VD969_07590 [Symbiobacteriaceae bacterium]|nr:hypothetical protein [Symbiobacteriaceae bacterium]